MVKRNFFEKSFPSKLWKFWTRSNVTHNRLPPSTSFRISCLEDVCVCVCVCLSCRTTLTHSFTHTEPKHLLRLLLLKRNKLLTGFLCSWWPHSVGSYWVQSKTGRTDWVFLSLFSANQQAPTKPFVRFPMCACGSPHDAPPFHPLRLVQERLFALQGDLPSLYACACAVHAPATHLCLLLWMATLSNTTTSLAHHKLTSKSASQPKEKRQSSRHFSTEFTAKNQDKHFFGVQRPKAAS